MIPWEASDRPMNRAQFEDGEEILLHSNSTQLATQMQRVLSNPDLEQRIVENARCKLERFHTTEKRVKQILTWVETGEMPTYG